MNLKTDNFFAIVAIIVALGAWFFPVTTSQRQSEGENESFKNSWYKTFLPNKTLYVSGTGASVEIRMGPSGVAFEGGNVSTAGAQAFFYVPKGQKLNLEISGTGATVVVDSNLMPYIRVSNTAVGAKIVEY